MKSTKKLYTIILILSLISTALLVWHRIEAESQSKTAEIIADYDEFTALGKQLGIKPEDVYKALNDTYISSVAIKEDTLYTLVQDNEAIEYDLYEDILKNIDWRLDYGTTAREFIEENGTDYDIVVRTYDADLFNRIKNSVEARYDASFYHFFDDTAIKTIVFEGSIDDIYYADDIRYRDVYGDGVKLPRNLMSSAIEDMGLGFNPEKINHVTNANLGLVLRPSNYYKYNSNIVKAYFDDLEKYRASTDIIIFEGNNILSYQKETQEFQQALYDELFARNIPVGMIESSTQRGYTEQDGIGSLAESLEYNVVRVFPVIEYIQQRYDYLGYYEGPVEIGNTLYRAITERNIRAVYLRPFKDSSFTYYDDLDEYKVMLDDLEKRLAPHGISLGKTSVMPYNQVSPYLVMVTALGILVLGIYILKSVFNIKQQLEKRLFWIGSLGVVGLNIIAPNLSIEVFAFSAAIVFPTLAILYFVSQIKLSLNSQKRQKMGQIILSASKVLIISVLISLIGGLTVGGIMSKSDYLVEMSFYRGVKASLVLPILIFVFVYLIQMGYRRDSKDIQPHVNFKDDVKRFLTEDVKMYYIIIAAVVGVIGYIYLARSGHETDIEVLNIEIIFRNYLENYLLARPRTKEILFAFPSVFISVYLASKQKKAWLMPFMTTSVIGFISIVNTFCHARTPIYLSSIRSLYSLLIGLIFGIVLLWIVEAVSRVYNRIMQGKTYE